LKFQPVCRTDINFLYSRKLNWWHICWLFHYIFTWL